MMGDDNDMDQSEESKIVVSNNRSKK